MKNLTRNIPLITFAIFFLACGNTNKQKQNRALDKTVNSESELAEEAPETSTQTAAMSLGAPNNMGQGTDATDFKSCGVKFIKGGWAPSSHGEGTFRLIFRGKTEIDLQGVYNADKELNKTVLRTKTNEGFKIIETDQLIGGMKGSSFLISLALPSQYQFTVVNVMGVANADGSLTGVDTRCR